MEDELENRCTCLGRLEDNLRNLKKSNLTQDHGSKKKEKSEVEAKIKEEEANLRDLECQICQHEKILTRYRLTLRNLEKESILKSRLKCSNK